jgi:tRNA threonylcarbamoyladenosine biosynthesis protein TsaB
MPYILNIETATKNCSVAVANDGQTLISRELATDGYSHAEKLHVFIQEILPEARLTFKDLSAIAVSKGPGSYTGLRIGVSAAKGLCYALDIPLISIDTLQVLASQANIDQGLIVPMLDARRMEVYSAVFDADLNQKRGVEAEIITENSFADCVEKIWIAGDCQEKVKSVLHGERFGYLPEIVYPSAKDMAAMSFAKYLAADFENVAYFEPFYLKDFMTGGK